jgi:hypothetical protein
MKKLMFVVVALALGAAVLPGCKASAEVDDANTTIPAPR